MERRYLELKDLEGNELYEGDKIKLAYVDPFGRVHKEMLGGLTYEIRYKAGSYWLMTSPYDKIPIPVIDYVERHEGDYISNYGNEIVYGDTVNVLKVLD